MAKKPKPAVAAQPNRATRVAGARSSRPSASPSDSAPSPASLDERAREIQTRDEESKRLASNLAGREKELDERAASLDGRAQELAEQQDRIDAGVSEAFGNFQETVVADFQERAAELLESLSDPEAVELATRATASIAQYSARLALVSDQGERVRLQANIEHAINTLQSLDAEARSKVLDAIQAAVTESLNKAIEIATTILVGVLTA